jgi:hypothetical protein
VLRQFTDRLADEGDRAIRSAAILAARGWPTTTNGTDRRSADTTTSTERAALEPGPWDDVDNRLARQLRLLFATVMQTHATFDLVATHVCTDSDCDICADIVPGGTGRCAVDGCDHTCNPRKNPNDRLRAGFCPRHHKRWLRLGRPDRGRYIRFTETEDAA